MTTECDRDEHGKVYWGDASLAGVGALSPVCLDELEGRVAQHGGRLHRGWDGASMQYQSGSGRFIGSRRMRGRWSRSTRVSRLVDRANALSIRCPYSSSATSIPNALLVNRSSRSARCPLCASCIRQSSPVQGTEAGWLGHSGQRKTYVDRVTVEISGHGQAAVAEDGEHRRVLRQNMRLEA